MRFSDIKVGYIYNVIFDPVRDCEFDGKHLAVVLKKNNDKTTFIVMPLTSSPNGVGVNKLKLDDMKCLPSSLKMNNTYAVYNQIRTVNADRFIALKEGKAVKECQLEKELFHKLLILGLREMVYSIPQDERIEILKNTYEGELILKAKDMAYQILKLRKVENIDKKRINELLKQIKEILYSVVYLGDKQYIEDGIERIFDEARKI